MSEKEAIKIIKDICSNCIVENNCPFFNKEYDSCIFWLNGIAIPSEWSVDSGEK